MLNRILLEGNLVADPETCPVGTSSVTKFRLASTRTFKAANGEKRSKTTFIDCAAWNGTGQNLARFFKKGDPILLEGRLEFDEWTKDEKKHSRNFIDISEFHFPRGHRLATPEAPRAAASRSPVAPGGDHLDEDVPF